MGEPLDIGLLYEEDGKLRGEHSGTLPSDDYLDGLDPSALRFAQVILGIGQGKITWTPVQAANAYATLARGGVVRDATLVRDDPRPNLATNHPGPLPDLPFDPHVIEVALDGLGRAVRPGGTGHHITYSPGDVEPIFNAPDVTMWGKTGTAQAPALPLEDSNGDGVINGDDTHQTSLDHAWFVGLVAPAGETPAT